MISDVTERLLITWRLLPNFRNYKSIEFISLIEDHEKALTRNTLLSAIRKIANRDVTENFISNTLCNTIYNENFFRDCVTPVKQERMKRGERAAK